MDAAKSQHLSEIFLLCDKKETGTIFITNNINHSCQVVIEKGEIMSMAFGQLKGDEVINSILKMKIVRFSFRKDLVLPMPAEAKVSSSKEILQSFTDQQSEKTVPPQTVATPEVKSSRPVIKYRGQVVQNVAPKEAPVSAPVPEVKSNKPVRIYRGQVVQG